MRLGVGQQLSPSLVNSIRVAAVAERLASHVVYPSSESNSMEFFNLCLSLARGIDYAVAHNQVPAKAQDLPFVLKQVCQRKNDFFLQAAIMVLMISVKNACNIGWFSDKESQELLGLANEIGSGFSRCGNIKTGPSNLDSTISTIMTRFYPQMKMGHILASLEIEPGYGAFMVDFAISKNTVHSPTEIFSTWTFVEEVKFFINMEHQDAPEYRGNTAFLNEVKMHVTEQNRLFVARTDNMETSACIISPQEANFLINGRGVDRRTNVLMDPGPQMPTNVIAMLKFGTNLLQAVGQFNGHYIVVVAFMSMAPSLDSSSLQDYVQPGVTLQDSDADIIEGPSRVSLNCPISYTRIRIPVKGHSCRHLQCFDFSNFVNINSRRPSWRCPHCNQHVCYTDIRLDQNMVQVLREVGKNVVDVIISADGSWKAVLESDDNMDWAHDKVLSGENKGLEQQESPGFSSSGPVVLDLTRSDDEMDVVITCETEDRKPNLTDLQSQPVATNITRPSELSNTFGVDQNVGTQTDDNFWSGIYYSNGSASSSSRLNAQILAGMSEPASANFMTSALLADAISPAVSDAVAHALHREAEACGYSNLTTSVMQSQYSTPNNMQLQQSQFVNNQEYGRLSQNRHLPRTPIAIQALPAQSQIPTSQQRSGTDLSFLTTNGSSLPSLSPLSAGNSYADMERHQQFSRSQLNAYLGSDMASSSLQHQSASQNWNHQDQSIQQVLGISAPSMLPGAYRVSSGLSTENQSLNQQQAPNLRMPQSRNQSPRTIQSPSPLSRTPTQQGSAPVGVGHIAGTGSSQHARNMVATHLAARNATQITRQPPTVPVQVQTSRIGPTHQVNVEGIRASAGEQMVNRGGLVQPVRAENLADLSSEQNWRPTGRMRGSLSGRAYSAALSQFMIQPTQPAQSARPFSNTTVSLSSAPPHLQALLASRSASVQMPNNPTTEAGRGSGILPERSLGLN